MKYFFGLVLSFLVMNSNIVYAQNNSKNKIIKDLDELFGYLYKNEMFNGAVGVKYKGSVIYKKGFGKANFETDTKFTPASQTEIASVSKQFTATAIMILWKDGKLQLEDDMNDHLSSPLPYKGITIKQLLSHQSGLPNYTGVLRKHWNHKKVATNEDIFDLLRKYHPEPLFGPGEKYKYSNTGYLALAQIVKNISGKQLDEFLEEHVFLPFGMSSTGFFARPTIYKMPLYAPGVIKNKETGEYTRPESLKRREYVWYLSGRFGSGRLTSSVNDLLTWDSLLYTNSILPQPIIKEMFKPQVHVPSKKSSYGFGWRIDDDDPSVVYHTGSWPGNLTYIKRFTKERSTIVVLNNTSSRYMATIRNTVDAIVSGEKWDLPKKR